MSGQTQLCEEYESVDLTEDEDTDTDIENFVDKTNPEATKPVSFVDCSTVETSTSSAFTITTPPPLVPINIAEPSECLEQRIEYNSLSNIIGHGTKLKTPQIKNTLTEPYCILKVDKSKNVCIETDAGKYRKVLPKLQNIRAHQTTSNEPPNQAVHSQKQMGKLVVIKKNNKYYKIVIPHNVIPNINQSTGPVLINIPEVGPLVISSDPQIKTSSFPLNQPFSLNFDDIQQNQPKVPIPKEAELDTKASVLYSKKFCWSLNTRRRKIGLDGLSWSDKLGFSRAETQRTKRCSKMLDSIIRKKKSQLVIQMHKFDEYKTSVIKKNKVKLVKINAIVGTTSKEKRISTSKSDQNRNLSHSPPHRYSKNKHETSERNSPNLEDTKCLTNKIEQTNDYDSDLLLTKKVVILDDEGNNVSKRKPKITKKLCSLKRKSSKIKQICAKKFIQHKKIYTNSITDDKSLLLKPCYVEMVREMHVEEAYRKYCKGIGFRYTQAKMNPNTKIKLDASEKPKINRNMVDTKATTTKIHSRNPAKLETNPKKSTSSQSFAKMFDAKIIRSKDQLKKEIHPLKPILIVNEDNHGLINYSCQFSKNNIIYITKVNSDVPVNVLRNKDFISALELGYLKLVDAQLFCRYLTNSGEFKKTDDNGGTNDHSYCLSKNKSNF